jgi:uncharacterized protein involved in exopolysaccharide biosynthesis
MGTLVQLNIDPVPKIEAQIEKLELLHKELDDIMEAWNEVEQRLESQQEIYEALLAKYKGEIPLIWKIYSTTQTISEEDYV